MKRQYRIEYIDTPFLLKSAVNKMDEVLASYGNSGWELVSCSGSIFDKRITFIFKKSVQ